MKRTWKSAGLVLGLGLMISFGISTAYADVITFNLDTGNSAISGFQGPYVMVKVDLTDSTHATLTYTSLNNPGPSPAAGTYTYAMAGQGLVGANVNASSFTVGSVTETNPQNVATPTVSNPPGTGAEDGFGKFNLTIDNDDGFSSRATQVSFIVTDTSGTWASASNVLTANSNGAVAAVHVFVVDGPLSGDACPTGTNGAPGACTTGFGAGSNGGGPPQEVVPEPSSLLLLGTGILGLAAWSRKRVKA